MLYPFPANRSPNAVAVRTKKILPQRFTISELARHFDISTRSIRFYEEKGLIAPRRTKGNQRTYSDRERVRLKLILRGKRFGYSLDEIAEMIGLTDVDLDEVAQIRKSLVFGDQKLKELRARIRDLQLLEKDLAVIKARLVARLAELEKQ
jgi:DNA-binding transcriptional MerR regulator